MVPLSASVLLCKVEIGVMNGRRDGLGRWYLGLIACNPELHISWKQNPCLFENEIKEGCLCPRPAAETNIGL